MLEIDLLAEGVFLNRPPIIKRPTDGKSGKGPKRPDSKPVGPNPQKSG